MLLVPRQLLRSGMTGNVPYYGGRFTPAQALAAAHPTRPAPRPPAAAPAGVPARARVREAATVLVPTRGRRSNTCATRASSPTRSPTSC